ncbi:MAG: hypothetical protein PHW73_01320 [Atribacterota bacterium]|nr:hypothetical protein [Atribacterota bacterium]
MQLDVKIDVPDKLKKFLANPTPQIDSAIKEADREAFTLLKNEISKAAPKKSGNLAGSITIDLAKRKIFSPLIYARAVELGHYAEPVSGKYLHFIDKGKDVFLKFVRTKKQPFFFKTLHAEKVNIIEIYDKAFKRLLENV